MASLLTLPREIRNIIFDMVCIEGRTNERPDISQSFGDLIQDRVEFQRPRLRSWNKLVLSDPRHHISNVASLMLVNRQVQAELLENMELLPEAMSYDLDIVLLDEILPLVTWTYVPALTKVLQEVNVTFRISGNFDAKKEKGYEDPSTGKYIEGPYEKWGGWKGFRIGDGAGPAILWQFYSILERFIRVGPVHEQSASCKDKHITIKQLNINVESPPGVSPDRLGPPRTRHYRRRELSLQRDVLDPEILARTIGSDACIGGLLNGNNHEWFHYGKILFEHVDDILVMRDGHKVDSFDVARKLQVVDDLGERYVTPQQLAEYKAFAWRVRKERGLRVLD